MERLKNRQDILLRRVIGDHEETQAELQASRDQLERRVQERTAELQVLNAKLAETRDSAVEASRAKSAFLATMSHELRTPLNAIIGYGELIQEWDLHAPVKEVVPFVDHVLSSARLLLALINDVLDLSRIEARRVELQIEPVLLRSLLSEIAITVRPLITGNLSGFVMDVPSDIGVIVTDRLKLRQVLLNLLSNAAKFTKAGMVILSAKRAGEVITMSVSDTGIGIAKDKLNLIFEPFTQADNSTTRKYGGTGLGLAISSVLCELMGGRLEVESTLGEGTTFSVVLPARENRAQAQSTRASGAQSAE